MDKEHLSEIAHELSKYCRKVSNRQDVISCKEVTNIVLRVPGDFRLYKDCGPEATLTYTIKETVFK